VPAQSGSATQVFVFARVVTPSGVTGPLVQSAAIGIYAFPTVVGIVSSATLVQHSTSTVTLSLSAGIPTAGTAAISYATTTNAASPTSVGSFAVTATGTVSFPVAVPTLGSVYFYVKAKTPAGVEQPAFVVGPALTVREYIFPSSLEVASTIVYVEGAGMTSVDPVAVSAATSDPMATGTLSLSYNTTATATGATAMPTTTTLGLDGKASLKIAVGQGTRYLFARVTAPGGAFRDFSIPTPVKTLLSPLWPSTSTSTSGRFIDIGGPYSAWQGDAGNFGSGTYWTWVSEVYDTTIVDIATQGRIKAGYFSNSKHGVGPQITYCLNYSFLANPSSFGGDSNSVWWFRWGYKKGVTARRYALATPWIQATSAAQFTITGYADISFSSGTVLATIPGTSVSSTLEGLTWTNFASPAEFAYYEFRQTSGPFIVGLSMTARLGN
jgi:hypothetical protein